MIRNALGTFILLFCTIFTVTAQTSQNTVIFYETGFPSADSASLPREILAKALPNAVFADSASLPQLLSRPETHLLLLPFGSAFPESDWPAIHSFLQRGGNLLVLGGKPFTRSAHMEDGQWRLRDYSVRFSRQLLINDYVEIELPPDLRTEANPEVALQLPSIPGKRAFSPIIRLSTKDIYPTEGSAGSLDARLDTLQWADLNADHVAASAIAIDHMRETFAGGRWVLVPVDLSSAVLHSDATRSLISSLAGYALRGAEELSLRTSQALVLPDETVNFILSAHAQAISPSALVEIRVTPEGNLRGGLLRTFPLSQTALTLPAPERPGFYRVEIKFKDGDRVLRIDHTAFWVRDDRMLDSGKHLSASGDFFSIGGRPSPIVGTTYMSSDVQRQFLIKPNPYVWDHDMQQIAGSGLNLVRTGLWSGWRDVSNEDGSAREVFLRNLEAFLLTARRHDLSVQFTFFSFLPESFSGANSYFDPSAVDKQQNFIRSIVRRFKDVPYLSYDLINEPSFSRFTWRTRPNGDAFELSAWNKWLRERYKDRAALAEAWNLPALGEVLPVPAPEEFGLRGAYVGNNGLKVHDFYLFSQDSFADWAHKMAVTIRDSGSIHPITVGQDDGGYQERLNPAFFADDVDFTTNHTWWLNDDLLWCSLVAKQPRKPMLIQEVGLQRELNADETMRRAPGSEAALLERKLALSLAGGAGAVEWLWNVNSFMSSDNEVPIGAIRTDGSVKPDVMVLRNLAAFTRAGQEYFHDIEPLQVAIVTSQALQYSPRNSFANAAQQRAVRALFYHTRVPAYVIAENRLSALGDPKLVVLPSPQALAESTWQRLLGYVRSGGHLLITGPVERDEHWRDLHRAMQVGVNASLVPLTFHRTVVRIDHDDLQFDFLEPAQTNLEVLQLEDSSNIQTIKLGQGSITWVAAPIELSEDIEAVGKVYSSVARSAGIAPTFRTGPLSSGVLVYPQLMKDAVLYIFESESGSDESIDLEDAATHAHFVFKLPAQRAAMALIRRSDGKIIARYGF